MTLYVLCDYDSDMVVGVTVFTGNQTKTSHYDPWVCEECDEAGDAAIPWRR